MKRILLLGSTGSIGQSALDVVRQFPDRFSVVGLGVHSRVDELAKQHAEFSPHALYIADKHAYSEASDTFGNTQLFTGHAGLSQIAADLEYDILVNALVGSVGFLPTYRALEKGNTVALANKESLVCGGDILMPLAHERGAEIIPIDSEHSAIFQILRHFPRTSMHKIILTASGGPFRKYSKEALNAVNVSEALAHPTWKMGNKITVDSATMSNKGLEVIEAHHLFNAPYEQIDVVVHPQSIVHSFVEMRDGEIYAQLGPTDMRYPIQNALTYPAIEDTPYKRLDIKNAGTLTFEAPDTKRFPMLALAYECGRMGGLAPAAYNAANEVCVAAFLAETLPFTAIAEVVGETLHRIENAVASFEGIQETDTKARLCAREIIGHRTS